MLTAEMQYEKCRAGILGGEVRMRRLATNSLIVYVGCEAGEDTGFVIWLEPTWNLRDSERVLTGSRTAQDQGGAGAESGFERAGNAVDVLVGQRVVDLRMDSVSGDLRLDLTGGLSLRTFVSKPETDHLWHIHEGATKVSLYRGGAGWKPIYISEE